MINRSNIRERKYPLDPLKYSYKLTIISCNKNKNIFVRKKILTNRNQVEFNID